MARRASLGTVLALASLFPLALAAQASERELLRFLPGRIWAASGLPAAVDERAVSVDLAALLTERPLLTMPDGSVYILAPSGLDLRSQGDYAWRGNLFDSESAEEAVGRVTLTVKDGAVRGVVSLPGASYRIVPVEGGGHRLVEVDDRRLDSCGVQETSDLGDLTEPVRPPLLAPSSRNTAARQKPDPPSTIRLLVLYTAEALRDAGGREQLEGVVRSDVDLANSAFANSRVLITLELAGLEQVDLVETDLSAAFDWARAHPRVDELRRKWDAPLVTLVFAKRIQGACGVGDLLKREVFLDRGVPAQGSSIVRVDCLGGYTLAHEVGHTFGCEHDPAWGGPVEVALFPFGYGHFVDGVFRTVMSYPYECRSGCPTAPHFSNPAVRFAGRPTGMPGRRDNSRVLNMTRTRFTGPREPGCQPGPNTLCLGEGRFRAQVEWFNFSNDGVYFGRAVPGTDEAGYFAFADPAGLDVAVKVREVGGRVDVRYGSLTGEPFQLFLTDLQTGRLEVYKDYQLGDGCGRRDADAFATTAAARSGRAKAKGCVPSLDTLCLHGRFQVKVDGPEGAAGAAAISRMAGAFDFGDDGYPELAVKIAPQGKRNFDVFYGSLTDQAYTITITDTRTGAVKTYENPAGRYCGGSEGAAF